MTGKAHWSISCKMHGKNISSTVQQLSRVFKLCKLWSDASYVKNVIVISFWFHVLWLLEHGVFKHKAKQVMSTHFMIFPVEHSSSYCMFSQPLSLTFSALISDTFLHFTFLPLSSLAFTYSNFLGANLLTSSLL